MEWTIKNYRLPVDVDGEKIKTNMLKEFLAEKDQKPYQDWLAKNPTGFVANVSTSYQNSKRGYMLHKATCYTLLNSQGNNPTANSSAKICGMTEAELDANAGFPLQRCSKCM